MIGAAGIGGARLLAVLLLACGLGAAELVVRDLGLAVGLPPAGYSFTIHDSNGERSGDDAFDQVGAAALAGAWSLAGPGERSGLVLGGRLGLRAGTFAEGGGWSCLGPEAQVGWGLAITDRLVVVPSLLAGVGWQAMRLEPSDGSFDPLAASGLGWGYGAQLAVSYAIADRWVVGLEAGWRRDSASLSGDREVDLDVQGLAVGMTLSWRFAATPRLLE